MQSLSTMQSATWNANCASGSRICHGALFSSSRSYTGPQHRSWRERSSCCQHKQAKQMRPILSPIHVFPFDLAWAPDINAASVAPQLFAASLFPYLGFLFYLIRSQQAPRLTVFGFCFLLVFVGATIPAGIYAKTHFGTSLANVDWLHGAAESLLTITNLFIVLGLRQGIRSAEAQQLKDVSEGGVGSVMEQASAKQLQEIEPRR